MKYVKLLNEAIPFNAPEIGFSVTGKEVKSLNNVISANKTVIDALKVTGLLREATNAEFQLSEQRVRDAARPV